LNPFLLTALLALAAPEVQETPDAQDVAPQLREIAARVEEIRGLAFEREVPVTVVDRAALREYAGRRLDRFSTPGDLRAEERAYALLGLLPPGTSLLDEYTRLVEESAAGYYDPEAKQFFLLQGMPAGLGPILAAHELTHALEDQHFDLDARIHAAKKDADLSFAVMAVHEGSASLLMAAYVQEGLRKGWLLRRDLEAVASSDVVRDERIARAPDLLRRPLLGAYVLGARFLARGRTEALGAGGFPAAEVDRCYRDGPRSSEQILHPAKFWDPLERDDPREVPPFEGGLLAKDGWTREGEGVLGELMIGMLVGAPTPATWDPTSIQGKGWTVAAADG
jgi:hypothetical protein